MTFFYGSIHRDAAVLVDQQGLPFIYSVRILDTLYKTDQEWWIIGTVWERKRESENSVLSARPDNKDVALGGISASYYLFTSTFNEKKKNLFKQYLHTDKNLLPNLADSSQKFSFKFFLPLFLKLYILILIFFYIVAVFDLIRKRVSFIFVFC